MLTDLVSGLDVLKDFKLAMLFHDLANPAAPRLAENARSGRGMKDILLNFAAIREALSIYTADSASTPKAEMEAAMGTALENLKQVNAVEQRDKQKRMVALQTAMAALANLTQTEMKALPVATGLALGFNNLDGD